MLSANMENTLNSKKTLILDQNEKIEIHVLYPIEMGLNDQKNHLTLLSLYHQTDQV